jgi:hypothetical protein
VKTLVDKGLIELVGRTPLKGFMLSKMYFTFTNQPASYTKQKDPDISHIWLQVYDHMTKFKAAKMIDFEALFKTVLTHEQVKYYIYLFVGAEFLTRKGGGRSTYYEFSEDLLGLTNPLQEVLEKIKTMPAYTTPS